jgi:hypothetical protein
MLPEKLIRRSQLPALPALPAIVALVLAALIAAAAVPAAGDDRNTLKTQAGNPYVFIILDTSGSMNWAPPSCTLVTNPDGSIQTNPDGTQKCTPVPPCPTGDCYMPRNGDDPGAKIYQAKQAITQALQKVANINWGFASYNQDGLNLRSKHWLYQASIAGPVLPGYGAYPAIGAQEVFGFQWNCADETGDGQAGCAATTPADLSQAYQLARVQRLPKGNATFTTTQTFYVKTGGITYKISYAPMAGDTLGSAAIHTVVTTLKCTNASCTTTTPVTGSPVTVAWSDVGDFLGWDVGGGGNPNETNPAIDYFTQTDASDMGAPGGTCNGWDPNTDSASDNNAFGYSVRQPTNSSDARGATFTIGDVIPFDWKTDHNLDIQKRLAPNLELNPAGPPDYSIASYFNDLPWAGETFLRLPTGNIKDSNAAKSLHPPLMASGATPIGASLQSFRQWYSGCTTSSTKCTGGWVALASNAATGDPVFACSKKYVLFITDGDETCSSNPCGMATNIKTDGVVTFIMGFGLASNTGNALTCVAANGGSGVPFYPQSESDLEKAIIGITGSIAENPTAFASAAVPSVQAETSDKLFLTSFYPLNFDSAKPSQNTQAGIWDGHVNAFLKPLPLTAAGTPDLSRTCASLGAKPSSCLLWDGGQVLLTQAPTAAQAAAGSYQIGNGTNQRRVFYPYANLSGDIPTPIRTFTPPAGNPPSSDWIDLWLGLKLTVDPLNLPASQNTTKQIMADLLEQKSATVSFTLNSVTTSFTEPYVLGDTFHSDPVFYSNPDNFLTYAADLYSNGKACTSKPSDNPGYRCYAEKHRKRRKMLVFGANDGQVHAFDAGTWDTSKKDFNNGTGTEVFSYIPRLAMPVIRDQAATGNTTEIFSADGTVRLEDVFVDPKYSAASGPSAADREWRTVMIGGFREGGKPNGGGQTSGFVSGYYALDVTDPDPVDTSFVPTTVGAVASCLDTGSLNSANSNCGTNPFPSVLWEFTDSIAGSRLDEDGNNTADLGSTWSVPTVGRIHVTESGKIVDKFVAIFGGGFDPNNKTSPQAGNWIYIVDIETGKAIYKHALVGAAVADPAVVDTNQDGYLDTIYVATTAGFVYKMDISKAAVLGDYVLAANTSNAIPKFATAQTVKRVTDIAWDPFKIFDTGGLPIYLTPTTFFVTSLNQYALAFGTGDREDLWNWVTVSGNPVRYSFHLIVDEGFTAATSGLPKTAAQYQQIDSLSASVTSSSDFVITPGAGKSRGWYLYLQPEERVITQAFGLEGVLIFSTYNPDPPGGNGASASNCDYSGSSNNYVVFSNNANPVAVVGGTPTRFTVVQKEFVTNPFIEQGATKNSPATNNNSEQLDATQQGILKTLKQFYPKNTKFANYWISVSGVRSDTGYVRYATIPIGIVVKNWKEY